MGELTVTQIRMSAPITPAMFCDLVQFPPRTSMHIFGDPTKRNRVSAFVRLLWEKGTTYDYKVIVCLTMPILDLSRYAGDEKERQTFEAIQCGEPLFYSARITADSLLGDSDLLRREEEGYVEEDIKPGSGENNYGDNAKLKKYCGVQLSLYTVTVERRGMTSSRRQFVWDIHGEEVTYVLEEPQGIRQSARQPASRTSFTRVNQSIFISTS